MPDKVLVFGPYKFKPGQKIYINGGKRKGDWEIVDYDEGKVTLQCPVSGIKLTVNQFCFFVDEVVQEWPQKNEEK
jgi:hypothetical protein